MLRFKYTLILVLFFLNTLYSQDLKELYRKARESTDITLAEEVKAMAIQQGDLKMVGNCHFLIAYRYQAVDSLFPAILNYFEASKYYREIDEFSLLAQVLENIGIIYNLAGFKRTALTYYHTVLGLKGNLADSLGLAQTHYRIGGVHKNIGIYDSALLHYVEGLQLAKKLNKALLVSQMYNDIGILHRTVGDYHKADHYYDTADYYDSSVAMKARTLNNRGNSYLKQGDNTIAIDYFRQALKLNIDQIDDKTLSILYANLGEVQSSSDSIIWYYEQSFALIKNKPLTRTEAYFKTAKKLKELHRIHHDDKQALYYDSVLNRLTKELIQLNNELKVSYLHYQVEASTWKMTSELNRKNLILLYVTIVILTVSCLSIIFYVLYKEGRRKEKHIVRRAKEVYEILKS